MAHELSIAELDAEMVAELPQKNLMRRHRHHHHSSGVSAFANNGSGANAASQNVYVVPIQVAVGGGAHNTLGNINVNQHITQTNVPVNLGF